MKKFLLSIFVSLFFIPAFAIQYPSLEQVATKLYANYRVPEYIGDTTLGYQKKREGWYVALSVYDAKNNTPKVIASELFWSSTSGKYSELKNFLKGFTPGFSQRVARDKWMGGFYDYERCPYYGYVGWYMDIITDFGSSTPANDTVLEGLARAYYAFAAGYLGDQYGFFLPSQKTQPEKMRIDNYIVNARKSLSCYDILRKRNPHFAVLIGEVTTKYANDVMAHYETLTYFNRESELDDLFREELYDPLTRSIAAGMLQNCSTNGILFTNGDNDTYPLWYMQWIKGVRKDVVVLNTSLINIDKHLFRYVPGFRGTTGINLTLSKNMYSRTDVFYNVSETDSTVMPSGFFGDVYADSKLLPGDTLYCFRRNKIAVLRPDKVFDEYELVRGSTQITITLDKQYLMQSDMAILDIILSNMGTRGIYFATSIGNSTWIAPYLYHEGMVQRFIPSYRPDAQAAEFVGIASAKIASAAMLKFLDLDTTCADRECGSRWITNMKITCCATAKVMIANGDTAGAIRLLDKFYSKFPVSRWEAEPIDYYLVDAYYSAKAFKQGDEIGDAICTVADRNFAYWKGLSRMTEMQRMEKNRWLTTLDQLVQLTRKNARIVIAQKADVLLKANR